MTQVRNVAVIVGSLREASLSRKIALALGRMAPENLKLDIVEIGNLPFYNEDLEAEAPAEWTAFRETIKAADAVLFVTPEYNRSFPGALKNAIDVGSRPYGQAVWSGKPVAVASTSMGALGGFGANHHLRQSLSFFDMPLLQQPEAYFGATHTYFDEAGEVQVESTRALMKTFIDAFGAWVEKVLRD